MNKNFQNIYAEREVFITGHNGFKGSWLSLWLAGLNAKITGFSLKPHTDPNHFSLIDLPCRSITGDIRKREDINHALIRSQPEIVFHLAAQPLVRESYLEPVKTFATNIIGTVNLLEACRNLSSVKAIVVISSDKCYKNNEWVRGYRENDPLGGYDPYSASKACAELVVDSYRLSFFNPGSYLKDHRVLLASARAGNVIGGGDWSDERLLPDIMRAAAGGEKAAIRNPHAVRPWQHVLEPVHGYLKLGQRLLEGKVDFAESWNFGPDNEGNLQVMKIVEYATSMWPDIEVVGGDNADLHEASSLKLDCAKAHARLNWRPVWNIKTALAKTVDWYRKYYENGYVSSHDDLLEFISRIKT